MLGQPRPLRRQAGTRERGFLRQPGRPAPTRPSPRAGARAVGRCSRKGPGSAYLQGRPVLRQCCSEFIACSTAHIFCVLDRGPAGTISCLRRGSFTHAGRWALRQCTIPLHTAARFRAGSGYPVVGRHWRVLLTDGTIPTINAVTSTGSLGRRARPLHPSGGPVIAWESHGIEAEPPSSEI